MHLSEIANRNIQAQKDEALLQKLHNQQFSDWLRKKVQEKNYFMLVIDDYSRLTWVAFLKEKSEAFE